MRRALPALGLLALLGLSGCVAHPADAYYARPVHVVPAPVHVAPPALYFGGGLGHGRHWGHGGHHGRHHGSHRHWR